MKKIILFSTVFLLLSAFTISADSSLRVGKTAVSAHLGVGKSNHISFGDSGDSIAQLGVCVEYGIINHLSAGIGYVYVDGIYPLAAHGLDLFVKGYVFDTLIDLYGFDIYGKAGIQVYSQERFGLTSTFMSGLEWQSPFKMFIAIETGAELENSEWGYLTGGVLGFRF